MDKVLKRFEQIKNETNLFNNCQRWGMPRAKTAKRLVVRYVSGGDNQYLYGDVCDWIRDYHNDLTLKEQGLLAQLIIGEFVIKNCLL